MFDGSKSGVFKPYKPRNPIPAIVLAILLCLALVGMLVCMVGCNENPHPRGRHGALCADPIKSLRCLAVEVQLDHIAEIPGQATILGLRGGSQLLDQVTRECDRLPLFHRLILFHTLIIRSKPDYLYNFLNPYAIL